MSEVTAAALLYTQLDTVLPALPTQKPNSTYTPQPNVAHQRAMVQFAPPDNPIVGDGFYRLQGFLQVLLCHPLGAGEGPGLIRGQLLKAVFQRGNTMTAPGVTVKILRTPHMAAGYESEGFWKTPVSVYFVADINPSLQS